MKQIALISPIGLQLTIAIFAFGQQPELKQSYSRLQYGAAVKATIDMVDRKFHFTIAAGGGAGYLLVKHELLASGHLDFVVYNHGLGSPKPGIQQVTLEKDIMAAITVTGGGPFRFKHADADHGRYIPLYYFSNLNRHSLQNPFLYSLSLGSNLIFNASRSVKLQRVGFVSGNFHGFGLSYYNDGTPFRKTMGDGYDRYYTGGGIISYHGSLKTAINVFEVAYFKFTGYQRNAFEIANALDHSFVNYNDQRQQKLNKSLFSINIGSSYRYWTAGLNIYNWTPTDFQHKIHRRIFNGYHRVPYDMSITPVISGSTYTTRIGMQ